MAERTDERFGSANQCLFFGLINDYCADYVQHALRMLHQKSEAGRKIGHLTMF